MPLATLTAAAPSISMSWQAAAGPAVRYAAGRRSSVRQIKAVLMLRSGRMSNCDACSGRAVVAVSDRDESIARRDKLTSGLVYLQA